VGDDIRRLSDELARDPASLAFLALGEALRRHGDLATAEKVARRGVERHPQRGDAHDLLARVLVDAGRLDAARDAWTVALRAEPGHTGAHKGLGFLAFQRGDLRGAAEHLAEAAAGDPDDATIRTALATVTSAVVAPALGGAAAAPHQAARPSVSPAMALPRVSASAVDLFGDLATPDAQVLLIDADGLVLAGRAVTGGVDVGAEVGAHLSGVSEEADRAMKHLAVGAWTALVVETTDATLALAPAGPGAVAVVAADRAVPVGLTRRLLDRAATRARDWGRGG
jgi:predicted regulator of Ras-like GTPase activity (Roadblock/LC7/MglB family)